MPLKNKVRTALLVSLFFLALQTNVAQGQWYEIVHVDHEAQDAVAAKEQATAQAEKIATERFFSRVAPEVLKSPEKLDDVSSRCYAGMDILSEKTSGIRYIAKIQQNFNRSCVLSFLEQNAIPLKNKPLDNVSFAAQAAVAAADANEGAQKLGEPQSSKTLLFIVPANHADTRITPWSDNTELQSLIAQNLNNQNSYVVPLGDLNDQIKLPAIELGNMTYETFQKIMEHYESTQAVLLLIKSNVQNDPNPLTAIESYKISSESFKRCPIKEVPGAGKVSPIEFATFIAEAAGQAIQSCNVEEMLHNTGQTPTVLQVSVPISGYASWLKIKKDLLSLSEISKIMINEMAASYIVIDIHLNSSFENFQRNLQYLGLIIKEISEQNRFELRSGAATE
ncbi:MAG: hypothetical protein BGO28_04195 [Alphaproteobacteria bacterium 43-37]|nr:MAG: hypothetical protein BGO28_04195 [Alphaproteobacteria bacterium 43-37]